MRNTKHKSYFLIVIFGIVIFPFILLILSNRIQFVDFGYAMPTIFTQLFSISTLKNIPIYLGLLISTIIISVSSTVLLFDIPKSVETTFVENKLERLLRRFTPKHSWHVLLGYFISILAFNPLIAEEFGRTQSLLQSITLYQSYIVSSIIIATALVVARILSKLDLKIIDTNIGVFVILVYISSIIFASIATSYIPVEQLLNFITYGQKEAEGVFMIYFSELICALVAFSADWFVVKYILKKPL